jgi:uncharacterized protein (DUF1810 family)
VDIVQFAHKLEAYLQPIIAGREHHRCVQIVNDMNSEVARSLANQRPK